MAAVVPIVCELTDWDLQKRREKYLDRAAASLLGSEELSDGFRYRFSLRDLTLQDFAEIIDLERKCCPFLKFALVVEAGEEYISLDLTGPEGTKEAVRSLFSWN